MNVKEYILSLIADAHKWQYTDINGNANKPALYFLPVQWLIILIAVVFHILVKQDGFGSDFAGYCISALSIFVGLFLSLIITVFEKFSNIDFSLATDQTKKLNAIRVKNFFKQFSSLTSYSIVLAIFNLILMGFSLGEGALTVSIDSIKEIFTTYYEWDDIILNLIKPIIIVLYRIITTYFLLDFLYITIYAVGSIYDYMKSEYDKVKINK